MALPPKKPAAKPIPSKKPAPKAGPQAAQGMVPCPICGGTGQVPPEVIQQLAQDQHEDAQEPQGRPGPQAQPDPTQSPAAQRMIMGAMRGQP